MPEISEERLSWMRNRFVEMVQRNEEMSDELFRMREELNRVVDYLGSLVPDEGTSAESKDE